MASVQEILRGGEEGAQSIMARIEAGEDFAAGAEEFSQEDFSRENGGDVGWVNKNIMSPAFQEIVFSAELETLSEPIRDEMVVTKGGYWLIKVVGKEENREIDEETRSSLKAYDLTEWIKAMADDPANSLETFLDDGKKAWAMD